MIDRPTADADAPAGTHPVRSVHDSPAAVALVQRACAVGMTGHLRTPVAFGDPRRLAV